MSDKIMLIAKVFQVILLIILVVPVLYILVFAVAGLFYKEQQVREKALWRIIAVLIPAYKEDEVIIEAAMHAVKQNYPAGLYEIIVIADSLLPETIAKLNRIPVKVIEVSFEKSTKAQALNKAMEQLPDEYDIAVVLDADNIMENDFLMKINSVFDRDFYAVQGHRKAKNMNTSLSILDAASEEINNHIFRKGHRVLGLSSAIIGSGMAFRYQFFKELMSSAKAVGGFDKEIELNMLRNGYQIEYLDDACVYDEKVQKAEVFTNQRRRWLSAQFYYFRMDFLSALKALITKGNIDYFDKAFQFIQPPRILLLGAVIFTGLFFIIFSFLTGGGLLFASLWMTLMAGCISAFLLSLPRSFYNRQTMQALISLPGGMVLMLGSLLKIRGANKTFIHTSHTVTNLNEGV
jgi:cellulose synthase/poly-beta-1,6-N-acetylglucosamine synthase-like glycosyltransferase